MVLEVQKQNRENSHSLVRRFSKSLQRSGALLWVRKGMFKTNPKSRNMRKQAALRREERKKEYERAKKMGELIKRK